MSEERSSSKHALTMALAATDDLRPGRRAPRMVELLADSGWELVRTDTKEYREDPESWREYADRNEGLLAEGVATTRSHTSAAIAELGLDPQEVRAVVIEPSTVHVFRWSDRVRKQSMPILDWREPA